MEQWRTTRTNVLVSRLSCSYAFEDREQTEGMRDDGYLYLVEPQDPGAPSARLDMLWLTWMGEPGRTFDRVMNNCQSYWEGRATGDGSTHATPAWEWLFDCPLVVVNVVT